MLAWGVQKHVGSVKLLLGGPNEVHGGNVWFGSR